MKSGLNIREDTLRFIAWLMLAKDDIRGGLVMHEPYKMPGSLALWMRPLGDINRPTLQMYLDNLE
jgi:hypothetical protein